MPYSKNSELPNNVKSKLSSEKAKTMFRRVVNAQLKRGTSESVAFASAWSALKNAGYEKNDKGMWVKKSIEKASGAKPLYMQRKVMNAEKIVEWAKSNGFKTTLDPDDMHVTVVYSKEAFSDEYTRMAEAGDGRMYFGGHVVRGGKRSVERLGKEGEVLVLKIEDPRLSADHYGFRAMGASSDYPEYKPHITLSYDTEGLNEAMIEPYAGDIVLGDILVSLLDVDWSDKITEKNGPTLSDVHVPSTDRKKKPIDKEKGYKAPESARNNAKRALRWKEKYGDEVKGGTIVGWTRARQLANGETLSRETIGRMASFNRHRKNAEVDPKYKDEPWKDAGHVAWLLWGGTTGVEWAMDVVKKNIAKRYISDDMFTLDREAAMRSFEMGFGGATHVHDVNGEALFMPAATHEEYLQHRAWLAAPNTLSVDEDAILDYVEEEEDTGSIKEDLLEAMLRVIFDSVIGKSSMLEKVSMNAEILKRDDERRIVWGWASVISENGEPVVDSQGDIISPEEMNKMADEFMMNVRSGKSMHFGENIGQFIHSFPVTKELSDAFGLGLDKEGWIVGLKVTDDKTWEDVQAGVYGDMPSFSIGGIGERHAVE